MQTKIPFLLKMFHYVIDQLRQFALPHKPNQSVTRGDPLFTVQDRHEVFFRIVRAWGEMTAQSREEARWDGISEDATREILRQGEIYLDRTLQTAIAADQRATTLMG